MAGWFVRRVRPVDPVRAVIDQYLSVVSRCDDDTINGGGRDELCTVITQNLPGHSTRGVKFYSVNGYRGNGYATEMFRGHVKYATPAKAELKLSTT